ncbi:hypothetical protein GIB67_037315, partial [Kingdonia uniflora]
LQQTNSGASPEVSNVNNMITRSREDAVRFKASCGARLRGHSDAFSKPSGTSFEKGIISKCKAGESETVDYNFRNEKMKNKVFAHSHKKSGNVSISHLKTYLSIAANREDDMTIARAFILFMMGHLWFQTANDTLPLGYLAAVADLDEAAQYDWGYAIIASMYHGLDTAVTTGGAITGFSQLLEDLRLRRGRDVQVVPLAPRGGSRTRQRRSGLRTRGGGTSRRGRGIGDDYE